MWTTTVSVLDLCVGLHLNFEDLDGTGIGDKIRLCLPNTGDVEQAAVLSVNECALLISDWYARQWVLTPRAASTMLPNETGMLPANWVIRGQL